MARSTFISFLKTDKHYFTHCEWLNDFQEYHGFSGSIETGIRDLDENGEIIGDSFRLMQHGIRDLQFVNDHLPKLMGKGTVERNCEILKYLWKRKQRLYRAKVI